MSPFLSFSAGCYDRDINTFLLSDPCIHSDLGSKNLFGATDLGATGISKFLQSHKCNDVCRMLKLPDNTAFVAERISQLEHSSVNTSHVSVAHTNHLKHRQTEREIGDREVKAAKKHGIKERQVSPHVVQHASTAPYIRPSDRTLPALLAAQW